MPELTKPTAENLNDLSFCMRQAHYWLARCYKIGLAADPSANEAANAATSIAAYVDLNARHFKFAAVAADGALVNLFDEGFNPPREAMQ